MCVEFICVADVNSIWAWSEVAQDHQWVLAGQKAAAGDCHYCYHDHRVAGAHCPAQEVEASFLSERVVSLLVLPAPPLLVHRREAALRLPEELEEGECCC